MKEIEIEKDFAIVSLHISQLDIIADHFTAAADKEAEKSRGFFTRNAGEYTRIGVNASKIADKMRRMRIKKENNGEVD